MLFEEVIVDDLRRTVERLIIAGRRLITPAVEPDPSRSATLSRERIDFRQAFTALRACLRT